MEFVSQGQFRLDGYLTIVEIFRHRVMSDPTPRNQWSGLLARVRAGERSSQEELVEALAPQVARRVFHLCPRRDSVEDLSQEVFLKIFTRLHQYRGGVFEAWVDQVARRVCYDALRRQRVRPEWTFTDLGEELLETPVNDNFSDLDAAEVLERLFAELPPQVAWLLREVELGERGIGEVAEEMGWTRTAARLRLFRARKALKRTFKTWHKNTDYP